MQSEKRKIMKRSTVFIPMIGAIALALVTSAWRANAAEELRQEVERAINNLKSSDSTLTNFFEHSAGYVVFPGVRRSGLNPPAKPLRGLVYEKDKPVGEAVLAEPRLKRPCRNPVPNPSLPRSWCRRDRLQALHR